MSDTTVDPGPKRNPNDFLAGRADENLFVYLIITYLVVLIALKIFK
jgi:hypothetical protein